MCAFIRTEPPKFDELRARFQKMTDDQLLRFGKAAAFMRSPGANLAKPHLDAFVVQLEVGRSE